MDEEKLDYLLNKSPSTSDYNEAVEELSDRFNWYNKDDSER